MSHPTAAELFDPHHPRFTVDRFALMAQMREEAPVTFLPALHVYAVTRWQEVHDVLGDAVTFASSEAFSAGLHLAPEASAIYSLSSPLFAYNPINVDKPLHSRLRDALIAFQTPGLPVEVQVAAAQGLRELDNYMRDKIAEKAATPDEGLISALVAGRAAGENDLSEDELVADIAVVFFAGHETTINTIANALRSLLERREYWEAVAAGTMDTDNLIDELLRHDTSVMGLYRRAIVDTVPPQISTSIADPVLCRMPLCS
jgi:cytochrome P450